MGVERGRCTGTFGVSVVGSDPLVNFLDRDRVVRGVDFAIFVEKVVRVENRNL